MKTKSLRLPLISATFAILIVAIDQVTKQTAIGALPANTTTPFLGEVVQWYLVRNDAAAFSMGFGATWIFTVISSAAVLAAFWYSTKVSTTSWAIMLGILLGGIAGNLVDRLFRAPGFPNGHVVDFIKIPFNFPIFNFADIAICSIATLTVIRVMRGETLGGISVSK